MTMPKNLWKLHIALFTGYFLLAIVLTWPTITHISTYLPGDGGDDPAIAWNLWWIKYSLLNDPQHPFFSTFINPHASIRLHFVQTLGMLVFVQFLTHFEHTQIKTTIHYPLSTIL